MVFTSISIPVAYLDAANWQQQLLPPQPPPPPQPRGGCGYLAARMANVPKPETALKCPRCASTNTKFCYYNNYRFSQPRYICKACRRYWTINGALRDVPMGGRRRRVKRSKGGGSSSSSTGKPARSASYNNSVSSDSGRAADIIGFAPQMPPMMFMAPLHHELSAFGGGNMMGLNYGLSYSPISGPMGGGIGDLSTLGGGGGGVTQTQQFPFLSGLEGLPVGLHHPFEGSVHHEVAGYGGSGGGHGASELMTQLKIEDSSQFLGSNNNNYNPASEQYWSTSAAGTNSAAWTDIPGFSSSSTTSNQM